MSVTVERHATLSAVVLNAQTGIDAQGKPTYGANQNLTGRAVRVDSAVHLPSGQEVTAVATVWFPKTTTPVPALDDKLTLADGLVGIVVEKVQAKGLQSGAEGDIRVKIREL